MDNKDITLVILAAGMGSRFGGLKQIAPMGPNGEFIIDYSIYDAIQAGFTKVVFLIKEENYEIFKETIGSRVEPHIHVEYAFQKNDNVPEPYRTMLEGRQKPLGTAHAILCCQDNVHEPFMMINADDFYGRDAYEKGAEFLRKITQGEMPHQYGMVGYLVKNTITENGTVKRGVCKVAEDGSLISLIESSVGRNENGTIVATPLDESLESFEVAEDATVSMNMLLFDDSIFDYVGEHFEEFLKKNAEAGKLDKCEYLIPDSLFAAIEDEYATCLVVPTDGTWYGVTYKEDAPAVQESIKKLVKTKEDPNGDYPLHLWGE